MIEITEDHIDVAKIIAEVSHPSAGGTNAFIGTTRNSTSNKKVLKLEFESHVSMAKKEIQKIVDESKTKWDLIGVAVSHRVGVVEIGEAAVVIAVASKHRANAFEACRFVIDSLKKTVPIWKKEIFEDGDVWVAAHP